jgi:hypothetical protein
MPSFLPDHIRRGANRARPASKELAMRSPLNPAFNELDRGESIRFAFSLCSEVMMGSSQGLQHFLTSYGRMPTIQ